MAKADAGHDRYLRFGGVAVKSEHLGQPSPCPLVAQSRREAMSALTSAFGGKADIDPGLRDVCF